MTLNPRSDRRSFSSAKKPYAGLLKGSTTTRNARNKINKEFNTIDVRLDESENLTKNISVDASEQASHLP